MDPYYPYGLRDMVQRSDTYAVISIQDTYTGGGFGFTFRPTEFCTEVLTLYFDDIARPVEGNVLFSEEQARQIIAFIRRNRRAETLLIHCYAGQSRSRAVAAFAVKMLGADNTKFFETGHPNEHVYQTLMAVYEQEFSPQP